MGTELKIGNEFASITVSSTEFVSLIKQLSGVVKDEQFRETLADMIPEVRRSYETAVDVFTPLYALDTQRKFSSKFSEERANIKKHYLKDITSVRTHCDEVSKKLEDLKRRKVWKSKIPLFRRSFRRLEDLAIDWAANDQILASNMEWLLKSLNQLLNDIASIKKRDSKEAYRTLTNALEEFEVFFLKVKSHLKTLDELSDALM